MYLEDYEFLKTILRVLNYIVKRLLNLNPIIIYTCSYGADELAR